MHEIYIGIGAIVLFCSTILILFMCADSKSNDTAPQPNPVYNNNAPPQQQQQQMVGANPSAYPEIPSVQQPAPAAVRESKPRTPPQSATEIPAPRYSTSAALKNKQAQVQYTPTASFADVIIDGVIRGDKIGEGAYGLVYKGTWNGINVAIKECTGSGAQQEIASSYNYSGATKAELEEFKQEAKKLQHLRPHANIVPFYGVCLKPNFSIVCQLCKAGSLDDVLFDHSKNLPLARRWRWLRDIAAGVQHLHNEGIVHRDLAARNVLLSDMDTAMLTDFGLSRKGSGNYVTGHTKSYTGPVKWMAPEQMKDLIFSVKSDVWMYGCVVFEVMKREMPWEKLLLPDAIRNIMSNTKLTMPADTPKVLIEVTESCWCPDPKARPAINQIIQILDAATDANGDIIEHLQPFSFKCPVCGNLYQYDADLKLHQKKRNHY